MNKYGSNLQSMKDNIWATKDNLRATKDNLPATKDIHAMPLSQTRDEKTDLRRICLVANNLQI